MRPVQALRATGLRKQFRARGRGGDAPALDGIELAAPRSALTCVVGPDGAGKTTLLRLAAGLLQPDAGELRVLDIDVARQPQQVQDRISYMPQRFGLYEDLSVQENLDLYADLHGVPGAERQARYARLLEMTDLGRFTARLAGRLSGGMKQKLGLACTLVRSPELLLLDEPTVGVDPLSRRELWAIVQQLVRAEGMSVVWATAYLDEAERCDHVVLLHQGRVLAGGPPAAMRDRAQGLAYELRCASGAEARRLQDRLDRAGDLVADAVPQGGRVRVVLRPGADAARLRPIAPQAPQAVPPRLEDGFMLILAGQPRSTQAAPPAASEGADRDEVVIEVRDLVRRFGDFTAVDRTSFQVRRGEIFGLLGPNGAGKTTTFRMLCGLLPATSGQLRVAGVDMRKARASARRRIGYVAQKFALYGDLTVAENLEFFGRVYGLAAGELGPRRDAMLADFELDRERHTPAGRLPGGYKQRLAMAAALLHRPEILFLDEPTSGADPLARREFWRRIAALAAQGVTVIVTTHFMEEAEYCDRIAIQDAGVLRALGTPEQVRELSPGAATMEDAFVAIVQQGRGQGAGA
jgi:ABC-2 type transport system ATP-binding protein